MIIYARNCPRLKGSRAASNIDPVLVVGKALRDAPMSTGSKIRVQQETEGLIRASKANGRFVLFTMLLTEEDF